MTAYCTTTEVRDLLEGVTIAVYSEAKVQARIDEAESLINSKLGAKYSVPFTVIPPVIETICKNIAAYFCLRSLFTGDSQNVNDWVPTFNDARKTLDLMAQGKYVVLDSSGDELTFKVDPIDSNTKDFPTTFAMDDIEDSAVSSDLEDEIANERDE